MKLYTLRRKKDGAIAEVEFTSNGDSQFCNAVEVSIRFYKHRHVVSSLWAVNSEEIAEKAKHSTEWYNACWDSPSHSEKPEDLEVVSVASLLD